MKIGIVTPTFPPKGGGIATSHYNIYKLLQNDHELGVFVYGERSVPGKRDEQIYRQRTPGWLKGIINTILKLYFLRYRYKVEYTNIKRIMQFSVGIFLLNRSIRKFSPDVLIVPDNNLPLYWLRKRKYKVVWILHNSYFRFRDKLRRRVAAGPTRYRYCRPRR